MEPLTDLEAAALGCIHRNQPCSAHLIRTRFRQSPSARFSDSAGSVYPMVRRLEKRGALASRLQKDGRRNVRYYTCTNSGRKALREWIRPPFPAAVLVTVDPLRTRMLFLELLTPKQRAAWLDQAEQVLDRHLEQIGHFASSPDQEHDPFLELARQNGLLEVKARLKWIRLARKRLGDAGLLPEGNVRRSPS